MTTKPEEGMQWQAGSLATRDWRPFPEKAMARCLWSRHVQVR